MNRNRQTPVPALGAAIVVADQATAPGSMRGAVDFIHLGPVVTNIADFFIVGGTLLFVLAAAGGAQHLQRLWTGRWWKRRVQRGEIASVSRRPSAARFSCTCLRVPAFGTVQPLSSRSRPGPGHPGHPRQAGRPDPDPGRCARHTPRFCTRHAPCTRSRTAVVRTDPMSTDICPLWMDRSVAGGRVATVRDVVARRRSWR
jgi:hypothetical protein